MKVIDLLTVFQRWSDLVMPSGCWKESHTFGSLTTQLQSISYNHREMNSSRWGSALIMSSSTTPRGEDEKPIRLWDTVSDRRSKRCNESDFKTSCDEQSCRDERTKLWFWFSPQWLKEWTISKWRTYKGLNIINALYNNGDSFWGSFFLHR